jgi:hypothetical protein
MHSFLGADEPTQDKSYMNVPERRKSPEAKAVPTVQANRLNIRQIEGGGIGYGQGYTTLETFLTPTYKLNSWLPFLDLRVHRFDNNKYAFNAGLGLRYFSPSNCMFWGANAYYDYRQTKHKNYKQVGIGLEALGAHWDYRINGYIPVSERKSHGYNVKFDKFKAHRLYFTTKYEYDMAGVNAEVAYHWMPTSNIDLTAALGPYYFQGEYHKFAAGGQGRFKATFLNAISIEAIGSYDNLFKWNGQGQLCFSIPLGPKLKTRRISKSCCDDKPYLDLRSVQPVQRFEIIVADTHRESTVAIDPSTGLPYNFVFVNNDPSSTPNGTYENPYVTLAQAQAGSAPGDIVYVYGGGPVYLVPNLINSPTPPPAPFYDGFVMQTSQKLWGSGIAHSLRTSGGKVKIPAMTQLYPALNSTTPGDTAWIIVTLADNAEVSGLYFPAVNVEFAAIGQIGTNNGLIENNIINLNSDASNSGVDGIHLSNSFGSFTIRNNTITAIDTLYRDKGIVITSTTPGTSATTYYISNNTLIGNGVSLSYGIFLNPFAGPSMSILNNTINQWGSGVFLSTIAGSSTSTTIVGNTFSGNVNTAIDAAYLSVQANLTITNNIFTNNTTTSNLILINPITADEVMLNALINNNTFQGNVAGSNMLIGMTANSINPISLQVNNNTFIANTAKEFVFISNAGPGEVDSVVNNNTILNNSGGQLVYIISTGGGSGTTQLNNNYFQGNSVAFDDVFFGLNNYSEMCLQMNNNTFDFVSSLNGGTTTSFYVETLIGNTGAPITENMYVITVPPGTCE